eukprot:5503951-Prymnesium_polylepis.1
MLRRSWRHWPMKTLHLASRCAGERASHMRPRRSPPCRPPSPPRRCAAWPHARRCTCRSAAASAR